MKCHYEILGVSQRATDDELKKSYRKMALQWHPDKNPEKLEEAKAQFQLIQAAYETLSDPQERAFYDRNRDSILRGKATGSEGKPDNLDLFEYYSSQCYSGFTDTDKGFYTVYRRVFEKIAAMDMQYMDDEEDIIIPNFGASDTNLEDVGQFYGYWISYCSAMDFRWADEYDMREAQRMGRWVERKIEKDNGKARQKARRQFNEEVRALVAFVRKRDKRWIARKKMMEEKVAENARKQEASQRRRREEREYRMKDDLEVEKANLAVYEKELKLLEDRFAEEWGLSESEQSDYLEEAEEEEQQEEKKGVEGKDERLEEPEVDQLLLDNLYCVACNKNFKTEKSKQNHQRSKKHRENIESLKATMTAEDAMLFQTQLVNDDSLSEDDLPPVQRSSKKKKRKNKKSSLPEDLQEPSTPLTPQQNSTEKQNGRKDKRNQKSDNISMVKSEDGNDRENEVNGKADSACDNPVASGSLNSESKDVEEDKGEKVPSEEKRDATNDNDERHKEKVPSKEKRDATNDNDERDKEEVKPKLKGKKAKDARKKAQENNRSADPEIKVSKCTVCGNIYPSKNKLFSHIKATGHAALKTTSGGRESKGRLKGK